MASKHQLAEWWCQLNMHEWPKGLGRIPATVNVADFTSGAFVVVDALARRDGKALWRKQYVHKSTNGADNQ